MPLPKPKKYEKKGDYISRFLKSKTAKKEFTDKEQRIAVAYSIWREKK